MRKHSRAPWSTHQATATDGSYLILRADGGYIGSTGTGIDAEEDARLMASAPEMLDALEQVDSFLENMGLHDQFIRKTIYAAILKARGES